MDLASRLARRLGALALLLFAAACGGGPAETEDPPVITIAGVTDATSYPGPVTIAIAVDRGSYEARLDGATFLSGQSVSTPGTHVLVVIAHAAGQTSQRTVTFTIAGPAGGAVVVRMFDLGANDAGGGGDAILITDSTAAAQVHALIDAGPAGAGGTNPAYVRQRLQTLGVGRLEFLLLTHAHSDHFDGIPAVLTALDVVRFVHNGQERTYAAYNNMLAQAFVSADSVIVPTALREIRLGAGTDAARATIIPPLPDYLALPNAGSDSMNNGSIGAELRVGSFHMFLSGDGEVEANQRWRTQFAALSADVNALKVGHHGANDAIFDNGFNTGVSWLTHTSPEVSIISANGTTHPRINALTRLLQQTNMRTYCTNVHGDITVRVTRAGTYTVTVQKNADADCVAGSTATS